MSVFAAWNPSAEDRRASASGGVATMLARTVLREGGVYFGTRWSEDLRAVVDWTEDDAEPFRNSRYVRSEFRAETRRQLEAFLEAGRTVLFVGTPCQVASLKALRTYPNLVCVDLLCHGTGSGDFLADEVAYLSQGRPVTDVRFREGPRFRFSLWNGADCLHAEDAERSPYLYGYLSGITLREACYRCPFASLDRLGDVTLGDFIGIDRLNASFVWTHSEKGEALVRACGCVLEERALEERLAYRPGILEPSARHPLRDRFLKRLEKAPFHRAIRQTLRLHFLTLPFRKAWKRLHHQAHLLKSRWAHTKP